MSKAYWIASYIEISDADKLASYAALALPAITAAATTSRLPHRQALLRPLPFALAAACEPTLARNLRA